MAGIRQASACKACARPISRPSGVAAELSDMFCALNGATRQPSSARIRHRAAVMIDLPEWDAVPSTIRARMVCLFLAMPWTIPPARYA